MPSLRQVLTLLLVKVAVAGDYSNPANPFANLFPNGIPPINPLALFEVLHLLLLLLPQLTTDHQKKDTKPIKTIERYGILRF